MLSLKPLLDSVDRQVPGSCYCFPQYLFHLLVFKLRVSLVIEFLMLFNKIHDGFLIRITQKDRLHWPLLLPGLSAFWIWICVRFRSLFCFFLSLVHLLGPLSFKPLSPSPPALISPFPLSPLSPFFFSVYPQQYLLTQTVVEYL